MNLVALRASCAALGRIEPAVSMELLKRALEVVGSAYASQHWLQHGRAVRTDETLEMLLGWVDAPRLG